MLLDYLKVSFLMMRAKPVRAALSLLGIYIGVLALVVILAIREGIRHQLDDLFRTEGAQVIFVHPGFDSVRKKIGRITPDELERLRGVPGIVSVAPRRVSEQDAKSASATIRAHLVGVDEKFVSVYRIPLVRGRVFLAQEVRSNQAVCLLTAEATQNFFQAESRLERLLTFRGFPIR